METLNSKIHSYEKLSSLLVVLAGFLIPLFFLPTTTEFFEFNKLALFTVITTALIILLGAKVIAGAGVHLVKSPLDLPILIYSALFILATLFSVDKTSSIWGGQGRWFPSLFGIAVLAIFYYIATPNLKSAKNIKSAINAFITSGTISTLVALMGYFGLYLGDSTYLKTTGFTLTGSTTSAVLVAALTSVLALYFAYRESLLPTRLLLLTAGLVNFVFVALTGTVLGWALFALGISLSVLAIGAREINSDRFTTTFVSTVLVVVTALTIFPTTKELLVNNNYPKETMLSVKESWVIAASTIQDYPILATGPSTFHLNFSRYRPLSLNSTDAWNTRFDKPQNEVFNAISTLGIVGLVALLFLGIKAVKYTYSSFTSKDNSGVTKAVAIAVFMLLAANLLTYATVLNTFLLVFMLTLLGAAHVHLVESRKHSDLVTFNFTSFAAATTTIGDTSAIKREYANAVLVTPFVLVLLFGVYLFGKTYLAEYYMRKALVSAMNNQATQAYDYQGKAININPRRDAYHTSYAQTNLILANALAAKQNLTDQDKQTVQTLVSQAIRSTRIATEVINPLNVVNWETRALIYRSLTNVADNASDWAINAYNTAIQLDPTNPALRIDLGGIYYAKGDFLAAANMFRQATALKSDYANAHYNFAQALVNLKELENAKKELEIVKGLVEEGSSDYNTVVQQLATLEAQATPTAPVEEKKPSVEQITGADQPTTQQPPLSNPSSAPTNELNPQDLPTTAN